MFLYHGTNLSNAEKICNGQKTTNNGLWRTNALKYTHQAPGN